MAYIKEYLREKCGGEIINTSRVEITNILSWREKHVSVNFSMLKGDTSYGEKRGRDERGGPAVETRFLIPMADETK